ncbi:hypothetical protein [Clostridium sp. BJN0013]|uniref:hypothetical protein n=1 Tax=Clostridium sp. BJN0013 TaxID=3236840 RepID=UPI0034C6CEEB
MELEIIAVYENLEGYILEMEKKRADYEVLWDKYAIQPYWEKISQWASFDMSDRKPKPMKDTGKLKQQIKLMKEINLNIIKGEFIRALNVLPNYDDDTIVIAIYPLKEIVNNLKINRCIDGNAISIVINEPPLENWGVRGGIPANLITINVLYSNQRGKFKENIFVNYF